MYTHARTALHGNTHTHTHTHTLTHTHTHTHTHTRSHTALDGKSDRPAEVAKRGSFGLAIVITLTALIT